MRFAQLLSTGTSKDNDTRKPLLDAVRYTQTAETLGWDEVWTTEHQFNPYVTNPCALTMASYLLGATQRITIGTGIVVLPNTHPVRLASQAALLQEVSGGRLRLGLGRGSETLESKLFGGLDTWRNGFPQALAELKQLLNTGTVEQDVPLVPTPPPISMLVAATSEASVQTAASNGLPFLIAFPLPDAFKAKLLDVYRCTAEACGYPAQADHWLSVVVQVADTREQARKILLERYVPWNSQATAAARYLHPPKQGKGQKPDQMVDLQAYGTPEDVAERLDQLTRLCGTRNLLIVADPSLEPEQTVENLERIVTQVKPMLG